MSRSDGTATEYLKIPTMKSTGVTYQWFACFPWYAGVFDNEQYDIEKVNYELMKYLRWSRERFKPWLVGV